MTTDEIISALKENNIDGETMQHILAMVGMEDQMLSQLLKRAISIRFDGHVAEEMCIYLSNELNLDL